MASDAVVLTGTVAVGIAAEGSGTGALGPGVGAAINGLDEALTVAPVVVSPDSSPEPPEGSKEKGEADDEELPPFPGREGRDSVVVMFVPLPLTGIVCGELIALSLMVIVALRVPVAEG